MLHSNMGLEYAHVPYAFEYADETARTTATGFTSEDVGKFARQLSDNSIWMLTSVFPSWVAVGSSGGGGDYNVDGGSASAIYLDSQNIDGGGASG